MKKSPFSTPNKNQGHFYRGSNSRAGYIYQQPNKAETYNRFSDLKNPNDQSEGDSIPFGSSTPTNQYQKGNWNRKIDRRNQRFSNTSISGSYNNQRAWFRNSPESQHYAPYKVQRHQQQFSTEKRDSNWHRRLPISEFIDIHTVFNDPWAELEKGLTESRSQNNLISQNQVPSQEMKEKKGSRDSSSERNSDEATINISSSYEEAKTESSVDLSLDRMNFSRDSININSSVEDDSLLTDSISSEAKESSL